jgi:putative heme degradation protein
MNEIITASATAESGATPLSAQQPGCNNQMTHTQYPSDAINSKSGRWYLPLSPGDLLQRLTLLSNLQVPCMIYMPKAGTMQNLCEITPPPETDHASFQLLDNDITFSLSRDSMHSIWLVGSDPSDSDGVVIEIYNCARALVARLFSLPDKQTQAIWQDVLGNPSLAAA